MLAQIADGASRKRVGIQPEGRAPAREGTEIQNAAGDSVGVITSGGFGPTVGGPVAMGYVPSDLAKPGTEVFLSVRGKALPAKVAKLPFVPPASIGVKLRLHRPKIREKKDHGRA